MPGCAAHTVDLRGAACARREGACPRTSRWRTNGVWRAIRWWKQRQANRGDEHRDRDDAGPDARGHRAGSRPSRQRVRSSPERGGGPARARGAPRRSLPRRRRPGRRANGRAAVGLAPRSPGRAGPRRAPRAHITAWRGVAPWPDDGQVEQDLVLSRAIVELFSDDPIAGHFAMRAVNTQERAGDGHTVRHPGPRSQRRRARAPRIGEGLRRFFAAPPTPSFRVASRTSMRRSTAYPSPRDCTWRKARCARWNAWSSGVISANGSAPSVSAGADEASKLRR